MYLAIVQNNPVAGDLRGNCQRALSHVTELAQAAYPPDLVLFPSRALCGVPVLGLSDSAAFAAECVSVAGEFIADAALPCLAGSMIPYSFFENEFSCESEILYAKDGEGGALGFGELRFMDFQRRHSEEHRHNVGHSFDHDAGRSSSISITVDGHMVCVFLEEYPELDADLKGAEIIIIMQSKDFSNAAGMLNAGVQLQELKQLATKNKAWLVLANLAGASDEFVFEGGSMVIDPAGTVVAGAALFAEDVLTYNINLSDFRLQTKADEPAASVSDKQLGAALRPLLPYEAQWRAISTFIRDYVQKNGFSDVILGLSGGLDSAVVAALATDALGCEHVHGLMMPGPFSTKDSLKDAADLAKNLGIKTNLVPIDELLKTFRAVSLTTLGTPGSALAEQNLQARMRMVVLMHLANTYGHLLLNTSNKSECAMGYSTLYGDTSGAIAPLGNSYKTEVYGLAKWRNEQGLVIPQNSIEKAPSAELYEGQKDSDSLPPYDVLDHILLQHIENGACVDQILHDAAGTLMAEKLSLELIADVLAQVQRSEYKRRQEPMAPVLGNVSFNYERNWPITNGFRDRGNVLQPDIEIEDYLAMIQTWDIPKGWGFLAN